MTIRLARVATADILLLLLQQCEGVEVEAASAETIVIAEISLIVTAETRLIVIAETSLIVIAEISDLLGEKKVAHLLHLLHQLRAIGTGLLSEVEADRGRLARLLRRLHAEIVAAKRRKPADRRPELAYRCYGQSQRQSQVTDTEALLSSNGRI